jgi:dihydrofolate reductase
VFSSTLHEPTWKNAVVISGDVVNEAKRLKDQTRGDLAIYGHGLLSETLLKNGLTDEIRLSVFPVLRGSGKLLFRDGTQATLRLIEVLNLPTGVVVTRYQPMSPASTA